MYTTSKQRAPSSRGTADAYQRAHSKQVNCDRNHATRPRCMVHTGDCPVAFAGTSACTPHLHPKRTECRWRSEQPSIAALKVHTSTGWPEQPDQFSMGISTIVLADGVGRRRADLSPPSGVCGVRPSRSTIIVALTMFLVRRRGRRYPNSLGRRGS